MNQTDPPNLFVNPWKDVPPAQRTRTTVDIPTEAICKLQRVRPGTVLQTTINILLSKLINELERTGLTTYNPDGYESSVSGCVITFNGAERSTAHQPAAGNELAVAPKAPRGNVRRGAASVARKSKRTPPVASDASASAGQ